MSRSCMIFCSVSDTRKVVFQ